VLGPHPTGTWNIFGNNPLRSSVGVRRSLPVRLLAGGGWLPLLWRSITYNVTRLISWESIRKACWPPSCTRVKPIQSVIFLSHYEVLHLASQLLLGIESRLRRCELLSRIHSTKRSRRSDYRYLPSHPSRARESSSGKATDCVEEQYDARQELERCCLAEIVSKLAFMTISFVEC
jgi:hypothetical protein